MFSGLIYVGLQSDANHQPQIGWLPWCGEDDCIIKTVDTSFAASEQSKQNLNMHNAPICTMSDQHKEQTNIYLRFLRKNCIQCYHHHQADFVLSHLKTKCQDLLMGASTLTFHMVYWVNTENKLFMHDIDYHSMMLYISLGGSNALRRKTFTVGAVFGPKWPFSAWRDDQNCAYD